MWARTLAVACCLGLVGIALGGCGGGGNSTPSAPEPGAGAAQCFLVDFERDTVEVVYQPQFVEREPGASAAELGIALTVAKHEAGNPGLRYLNAVVTNRGPGSVGISAAAALTGIDICVTLAEFRNAGGTPVGGGGFGGYEALNPMTGLPIYHLDESLAPGASSSLRQIAALLPSGATSLLLGVAVRAETMLLGPPALGRFWVSSVAGRISASSYRDGPYEQALFGRLFGIYYRESCGDLLVADYDYQALRRVADGRVSTLVFPSASCSGIEDIGEDEAGNIIFTERNGNCLSLTSGTGGTAWQIAGSRAAAGDAIGPGGTARFSHPEGIFTLGNVTYVCDTGNRKIKLVTYLGGSRTAASSYQVTEVSKGTMTGTPEDIVVDRQGYAFVLCDSPVGVWIASPGNTNWTAISAGFSGSVGRLAVDDAGTVYVTHTSLSRLRCTGSDPINPANWVREELLPGGYPSADGPRGTATAEAVWSVAVTAGGTVFFSDQRAVRRIDRSRT